MFFSGGDDVVYDLPDTHFGPRDIVGFPKAFPQSRHFRRIKLGRVLPCLLPQEIVDTHSQLKKNSSFVQRPNDFILRALVS